MMHFDDNFAGVVGYESNKIYKNYKIYKIYKIYKTHS